MTHREALDPDRMRRLIDVGAALLAELDPDAVLDRVLDTAIEVTGARYAALGILDVRRTELERFLTRGIGEETARAIGDLPRGRGVLGVLIEDPRPLRLSSVGAHPRSYGFPAGHPPMTTFLGVPIVIRGQAWGNLYLTDKQQGEFDEGDEDAAVILAQWAAIAIENARVYNTSESRRTELEKALRGLEGAKDVAIAIGQEARLDRVLELIVKRGRALVDARSLIILLRDGDELTVAAHAGYAVDVDGVRLPVDESTCGDVMRLRRSERVDDVAGRLGISPDRMGVADARTALLVPLVYRDEALGVLAAFDRGDDHGPFSEENEQVLRAFAASAATAVAMAQSVQEGRLRHSLAAAEAERRRWARELHDETLQGLAGLRILLASALRHGGAGEVEAAVREAIDQIEREIGNLRGIITELRPAALDAFGLRAALEGLVARHRTRGEIEIGEEISLPEPDAGRPRLSAELEAAIYRLVQEALTNVVKHADAGYVRVRVAEAGGEIAIEVQDDGAGFQVDQDTSGFGLSGMRERVHLADGTLAISSGDRGTTVQARIPARYEEGDGVRRQVPKRPRRSA